MELIATLRPWAFVLLAIWLIMWAIKEFVTINNTIYKGVMAVLAGIAGVLMLISS
jgi:hypothetical protein